MCMAGGVASRERSREEEEEEQEVITLVQEETTIAPPLWPPTDVDEGETMTVGTEEDLHVGYLQISDEPSSQTASRQQDEPGEVVTGGPPLVNGGLTRETNGHAGGSLSGAVVSNGRNLQERIVTVNGMEFHVYGNVSGLDLLGSNPTHEEDLDIPDSEEEEEEIRRSAALERAIAEANEADAARRAAPIPPEHRTKIVNAMKGINLGGFRPSWADSVPEDQWINKIKESANSAAK